MEAWWQSSHQISNTRSNGFQSLYKIVEVSLTDCLKHYSFLMWKWWILITVRCVFRFVIHHVTHGENSMAITWPGDKSNEEKSLHPHFYLSPISSASVCGNNSWDADSAVVIDLQPWCILSIFWKDYYERFVNYFYNSSGYKLLVAGPAVSSIGINADTLFSVKLGF